MMESERLLLRALTPDAAAAIVSGIRTDQSWAPDYPTPGDLRIAAFALDGNVTFASEADPWGLYVVVEKSSGLAIGGIGFKSSPNERGEVEIGYGICDSSQGRGVATEIVNAVCEFARGRASVILAETERANLASQRVLEKAGFLSNESRTFEFHRSHVRPFTPISAQLWAFSAFVKIFLLWLDKVVSKHLQSRNDGFDATDSLRTTSRGTQCRGHRVREGRLRRYLD
jgi:[ribosomal protein S5]-alanine N-acetyltransferase